VNPARPLHSVSVAAVIVDADGRCLVVRRRDNGHWEPPGGVLEVGEGIEEGLQREVREETGLDIEPGPLTGIYKNRRHGIVALVFRATVADGTEATGDETAELLWLARDQVATLVDEVYAVRLLDAYDEGGPHIRDHDGTHVTHSMTGSLTTPPVT
jgi:8-oxo-dGTP diphosphatase